MTEHQPAIPRPAATLVLLRGDPLEVLLVRRAATGSFPSALVFPGGTVDPEDRDPAWLPHLIGAEALSDDERALRIAALRETYEEVGLLLAVDRDGGTIAAAGCPPGGFRALIVRSGGKLPLDALVPFAHWITPEMRSKRWDTHFFLARAPEGQVARCDEIETMAPEWLRPHDALALAGAGMREIVFPTRLNLGVLDRSATVAAALSAAATHVPVTVLPVIERRDGVLIAHIPTAAGYGASEYPHF